jgi:hypothetical protein
MSFHNFLIILTCSITPSVLFAIVYTNYAHKLKLQFNSYFFNAASSLACLRYGNVIRAFYYYFPVSTYVFLCYIS